MTTGPDTLTEWLHVVRAEYLEIPGLHPTRPQVRRLWGLEDQTCDALLEELPSLPGEKPFRSEVTVAASIRGAAVLVVLLGVATVWPSAGSRLSPFQSDEVVVSGTLVHHRLTNDLFHLDDLWMRVEPDTLFHRWLLQGAGRVAAISLTREPDRFADLPNMRVLTGRLIHQTTPASSPPVHVLFLQDVQIGTLGTVTFETRNRIIAGIFDAWENGEVSIIVEIRPTS